MTDPTLITAGIAQQLNETNPIALAHLERLVACLGADGAQALLAEALEVEAQGGLMTSDQKRRRTPGGVFFHLARQRLEPAQRRIVWPKSPVAAAPQTPPFPWEERLEIIPKLLQKIGEVSTVKITLIGRPGRIIEKGEVVLTSMQSSGKAPALPKGLPTPPAEPTTYVVYIAAKQWRKVREALKNPEDVLIVEGYPVFDARLKAVAVFALNATTKLIQRAAKEKQREQVK